MTLLHIHLSNPGNTNVGSLQVNLPNEIHPTTLTYKTSVINFFTDIDYGSDQNGDSVNVDSIADTNSGSIYLLMGDGGQNWIPANAVNSNIGSGRLPVATCFNNHSAVNSTNAVADLNTIANYDIDFSVEKIPHSFRVVPLANDGKTRIEFGGLTNASNNYPFGKIKSIDLFFNYIKDEEKH